MNVKFLTLLVSSVSLIHGLQAMDDDEDFRFALALSLQQPADAARHAAPPALHLPAPRAAVLNGANNIQDQDDEDLRAALALSLRDHAPPAAHVANNAPEDHPLLAGALAEGIRAFGEQQRQQAQGNAEAAILAHTRIAHASEKLAQRRRDLNALHEEFQAAARKEMNERTRDEFRSRFKATFLEHCLDGEENTLKEIDLIDKSFAEAVESGTYETLADFEEAYKAYLQHRLRVRLSFANGDRALQALIRQDEAEETQLIREDFRQDIQYVQEREKAAKVKASDDLSQIAKARSSYRDAISQALGEFLKQNSNGNFESFKSFLLKRGLTVEDYRDILKDTWKIKDGIIVSINDHEEAEAAEAQRKARALATAEAEKEREAQKRKEQFLAKLEAKKGTADTAQPEKQAASSQTARKLVQEEAEKKAAEQAQKRAAVETGARAPSPRDQDLREARARFLAQKEKETAEAAEAKKRAAQAEQARKLAQEEAQRAEREEAQRKAREEAEAKAARERVIQRAKEQYQADLAARIAELRAAKK